MTRTDIAISAGEVAAWHYRATSATLTTEAGRPCVVMAHGFGATRDCGLESFAEPLVEAGLDCLVFDYRGFGASNTDRRQVVDLPGQLADYRAAIAAARELEGVDPARIAVWGVSLAGGHVFALAAQDQQLAAAIALTPATDGLAAMKDVLRRPGGPAAAIRAALAGVRDLYATLRRRPPVLVPLAGPPGSPAILNAPGALQSYEGIAGPSWRNEVAAGVVLRIAAYRPGRRSTKITCPLLVQIADHDQSAPPRTATAAAGRAARAEVRHYPCDHFDVYPGQPRHEQVAAHQVAFLTRHLTPITHRTDAAKLTKD
ncbi:MAG: alpha/beta fold hydrolase [Acidimicrobiales bacterium]|nr:alpha/beta fold hydrolase [Acidimicrobiales bacterium]